MLNKPVFTLVTENESNLPFYVKSVGGWDNQEHVYRPSGYTEYHWLHCVSGKGILMMEGKQFVISSDMSFFFYPGIPHEYYAIEEPWCTRWITFDGFAVPSVLNAIGLDRFGVYNISDVHHLDSIINNIFTAVSSKDTITGLELSSMLYTFLTVLKNNMHSSETPLKSAKNKQLQPVLSYMKDNFKSSPSLDEMASLINITPQHLCRLFKKTFNMRPFLYLTRYRIQKAKELMIESGNLTIREISESVGYNDVSYFCSIFKECEGMTPVEFKRMHLKL